MLAFGSLLLIVGLYIGLRMYLYGCVSMRMLDILYHCALVMIVVIVSQ